jgi:hypothetical protein
MRDDPRVLRPMQKKGRAGGFQMESAPASGTIPDNRTIR